MTSPRRKGRRVPPKGRGSRPAPIANEFESIDAPASDDTTGARLRSRSQNRAAKRAAAGVRPKTPRGGRVTARRGTNTAIIALAVAAVAVGAAVIALGNPFGAPGPSSSVGASPGGSQTVYGNGTCPTSPPAPLAAGDARTVTMETEQGTIVMRIDAALAPNATANFVALVGCKFYDGLTFHRLMPGFVIQGGDPAGNGSGGPGYAIKDDPVTTTYHRGTIAMARTPAPDSQGSQFFIVLDDKANESLSGAEYPYAILGEVTAGMDVVDAIAAMPNSGGQEGRANDPVVIIQATVGAAASASPSPASPKPSISASAGPTNP